MDNEERNKLLESMFDANSRVYLHFPSLMDVLLDYLEAYAIITERFFDKEVVTVQKHYDAVRNEGYSASDLEERLFVVGTFSTNLLRGSFLVAAYSVVEVGLEIRCLCVEKAKTPGVSLDRSIRSGRIHKYEQYLEKQGGVDFKGIGEWNKLQKYGELRNCVVHYRGSLDPKNTQLIQFVKRHSSLDVDHDNIVFKKGFCEEVVKTIRSFFQALDARLPEDCIDLDQNFGFH